MEIAKFALAYAIRLGIKPGTVTGGGNKWHTAGFDPGGEIANAVCIVFPETETPYRAIESLMNSGLILLGEEMDKKGTLDLLSLTAPWVAVAPES